MAAIVNSRHVDFGLRPAPDLLTGVVGIAAGGRASTATVRNGRNAGIAVVATSVGHARSACLIRNAVTLLE
jgi:hypothetical protein